MCRLPDNKKLSWFSFGVDVNFNSPPNPLDANVAFWINVFAIPGLSGLRVIYPSHRNLNDINIVRSEMRLFIINLYMKIRPMSFCYLYNVYFDFEIIGSIS